MSPGIAVAEREQFKFRRANDAEREKTQVTTFYWPRWAAMFAIAGAILGGATQSSATGASSALDGLVEQVEGVSPARTRADFRALVTRLETAEAAIDRCVRFNAQYGDRPKVRAILNAIALHPGELYFVSEAEIAALTDAVGRPIDLTSGELEVCVRARDTSPRSQAGERPSLGDIGASLDRCLAAAKQVGPNAAGIAALHKLGRGVTDPTFASAALLADLEGAVGDLQLTRRELELCAQSYNAVAATQAMPNDAAALGCAAGQVDCGNGKCCPSGDQCTPFCDKGDCNIICTAPACFPADATVLLEDGSIRAMAELRLGDRVQVVRADGSLGFSEIYLQTHKDALSAAPFVELTLASGRTLSLSPRHFIPTGPSFADATVKAAEELRVGDLVWSQAGDGMAADPVVAARTLVDVGLYNPLTMTGTIVVDGVVASAHSDWFLDGIVSPHAQAAVYQAILAPVRLAYRVIGPEAMTVVTEEWGVVDAVREGTTPARVGGGLGLVALLVLGGFLARRRIRHV